MKASAKNTWNIIIGRMRRAARLVAPAENSCHVLMNHSPREIVLLVRTIVSQLIDLLHAERQ